MENIKLNPKGVTSEGGENMLKKIICILLEHKDGKNGVVNIKWQEHFPYEYYFQCSRCGEERAIDNMQPFR